MRYLKIITVIISILLTCFDVRSAEPKVKVKHVFDIHAKCSEARNLGVIPGGLRVMIPIVGGNVEGDVVADILPGGADYQLVDTVSGRVEFNAIYTLRTNDSKLINVRNIGVSKGDYFTTSPVFEAPVDSQYDWLNNRIFICKPIGFGDGIVHLRVWMVE